MHFLFFFFPFLLATVKKKRTSACRGGSLGPSLAVSFTVQEVSLGFEEVPFRVQVRVVLVAVEAVQVPSGGKESPLGHVTREFDRAVIVVRLLNTSNGAR